MAPYLDHGIDIRAKMRRPNEHETLRTYIITHRLNRPRSTDAVDLSGRAKVVDVERKG